MNQLDVTHLNHGLLVTFVHSKADELKHSFAGQTALFLMNVTPAALLSSVQRAERRKRLDICFLCRNSAKLHQNFC